MASATFLDDILGLRTPAIGVTFLATPPTGVPHVSNAGPSSCSYWKRAAKGQSFFTEAADHLNCPIGAYTHGVDMPAATQQELQGIVGTMVGLGYLGMAEVSNIAKRHQPFGVAVYAPLKKTLTEPDVILVCGNARQIMLLEEAANRSAASRALAASATASIPRWLMTNCITPCLAGIWLPWLRSLLRSSSPTANWKSIIVPEIRN